MSKFIDRKWILVILVAALIEPFHYFLLLNYPLPGRTFMAYDSDEAMVMGVMRSAEYNFDNPWSPGEKVFFNGALASPYPYIPLGYLRAAFGVDAILMNIAAKFVFFFLFLLTLFKFMEMVLPKKNKLAFTFFIAPLGVMPLGYALGMLTGMEVFMQGFSFEFALLGNISRVYYLLPLATGFLSLILVNKNKWISAALTLGLTFLFYPFFGFAFSFILFLYVISSKDTGLKEKITSSIADLWKIYVVAGVFFLPWIYARFSHPDYFTLYNQNSLWWRSHLIGIVGSYFLLLAIIFIANKDTVIKYWKIFVIGSAVSMVVMLSELQILNVPPFKNIYVPVTVVDLSGLVLVGILVFSGFLILGSRVNREEKFILLFASGLFILSIMNPKYIFWMQYRMGYILHVPLAMMAALYFARFEKSLSKIVNKRVLALLIVALAVSSFMAYNYRFQMADRVTGFTYFDDADKAAMRFLETQKQGIVMASEETNYFLPVWSGKYVLYHPAESQYQGGNPNRYEKINASYTLYSGNMSASDAKQILYAYNVGYVFLGSEGMKMGAKTFDDYDFLEKIYDNKTKIYAVKRPL